MPDVNQLPKWAQKRIQDVERERDVAVRTLREYCDSQTPAPFRFPDYVSDGDDPRGGPTLRTRYVQAHRMTLEHAGIALDIVLREGVIDLQYAAIDARLRHGVILQPRSFQALYLLCAPESK